MGLIYLLSTYCVPGILESTQGKGRPRAACLVPGQPSLAWREQLWDTPPQRGRGSLITATGSGTDSPVVA